MTTTAINNELDVVVGGGVDVEGGDVVVGGGVDVEGGDVVVGGGGGGETRTVASY